MENEAARNGSATAEKKFRTTLDLPQNVNESLLGLTERLGITKSELIRRAIQLMEAVVDEKDRVKGGQLAIVDKDMNVVARIVGF